MDYIEVNIKLESNNKIYNIPIRKSDKINQLKEYCQKISNIPPAKQNLLYKEKILSDEKFISDYNIENNQNIKLVEKEKAKPENIPLAKNPEYLNHIKKFTDNKEINYKEISNAFGQIKDFPYLVSKIDVDKFNSIFAERLGSFTDIFGIESQDFKEGLKVLKDPFVREKVIDIFKDPSQLELIFKYFNMEEYPLMKIFFLNPQKFLAPQYFIKGYNIFKVDEKNLLESSRAGISVPPDPFGDLNSNQMMKSSGQMSNDNAFNNNNNGDKGIFGNCGSNIDYKEKFKDQMLLLKDMGFTNEENNFQALKESDGNINSALGKLSKYN